MFKLRANVWTFLWASLIIGILTGVVWALSAQLPHYVVGEALGASMTERQLATVFASDALFAVLVGIVGLVLGIWSWLWFQRYGWPVALLAVGAAFLVSVVAWRVGLLVAPSNFNERLAAAKAGDVVAMDLQLRALVTLAVGPFCAITPVMLFAAFWPVSDTEPQPSVAD